jgi:hypothetical protein
VVAVWLAATDARSRARLLGVFTGVGVLVAAWWLIRNVNLYGDPLALSATRRYNREHTLTFGSSSAVAGFTLRQIFIVVPPVVWKGFWYSWYGAAWPAWPFAPLWALAAAGLVGLRWARTAIPRHRHILAVLGLFAVGGLASVWVVGVQAWPTQGRWAMIGAPAFACLIALGFERLRGFRLARFALPLLSLAMSLGAVFGDVLLV